jgi:hypothetical protein
MAVSAIGVLIIIGAFAWGLSMLVADAERLIDDPPIDQIDSDL